MKVKDIPYKIGLTKTEFNVLLVLISVFLFGLSIKIFRYYNKDHTVRNFDYSRVDSLFYSSQEQSENNDTVSEEGNNRNYKQEVLELNKKNVITGYSKISAGKFININSANREQLISLPGVGDKTANQILELRNKKGRFSSIEEIKEVKGIGNSKFEKIKKYLIIE